MIQGIHDDPIPQETDPGSGLLIGPQLASPGPARVSERMVLEGRYAWFDPLDTALHRDDLYAASTTPDRTASSLSVRPAAGLARDVRHLAGRRSSICGPPVLCRDRSRHRTGRGLANTDAHHSQPLVHRDRQHLLGPRIAGTRIASEAMYLFAAYVLETLGYRRYEWKCDALNTPSRGDHPQPQSRHRLVRDDQRGVAGAEGGLRAMARAGEL